MEIIDHRLVGAVHLDAFRRGADDGRDDAVFQTSTLEALLDGAYEGDLTVGDVLRHGDLGIGTLDQLDGELVILDGEAWVARDDESVEPVPAETGTPFAVVCHFEEGRQADLRAADFEALTAAIDDAAPDHGRIVAVRVDGAFSHLRVRSVSRQDQPYPPLREVTADQHEWTLADRHGTVVGFRFPDTTEGVEVPGWHLHFLSDDRTAGGHVMELAVQEATARIDVNATLHVELPATVELPDLGRVDRAAEIREVEGR